MRAWIINIGDELLSGRVLNWNGFWIAKRLTSLGILVERIIVIGDVLEEISGVIKEALEKQIDIVVVTGGLGPTPGDITLEAIAKALGRRLVLNEKALEFVRSRYEELYRFGLVEKPELNESRIKMALVPEGADVIYNEIGVAPGVIIHHMNTKIYALPGVPSEAMYLLEKVIMFLKGRETLTIVEEFIYVKDESSVAESLREVMRILPEVKIKTYPIGFGQKKMLVMAVAKTKEKALKALKLLKELLKKSG